MKSPARWAAAVGAFLLAACAKEVMPGNGWQTVNTSARCAVMEIDNQGFADVDIYVNGRRTASQIVGHTKTSVDVCYQLGTTPIEVMVREIGGRRYTIPTYGAVYLAPGSHLEIVVGATPAHSQVNVLRHDRPTAMMTGANQEANEIQMSLWGARPVAMRGQWLGIWADVVMCLEQYNVPMNGVTPDSVTFWVADYIVNEADSTLAYGITVMRDDGLPESIVFQGFGYENHPTIISHEVLHAVTGITDERLMPSQCIVHFPYDDLPLRHAPPELLDYKRR